jgi:thiamine pyrophosphokinase
MNLEEGVLRAIIYANGSLDGDVSRYSVQPRPGDLVIAADGGGRYCLELGLTPDLVVGDFDSLSLENLRFFESQGSQVYRYPTNKDYTDLELALQHAQQLGADEILVLAALGGRWDQTLANLLLPAALKFASLHIRLVDGAQEISTIHPGQCVEIHGQPGDTVSLIPLIGDAHGVVTHELEYPLKNETLLFGSTRGISNVMSQQTASVFLQEGLLLCVHIRAS